jgi:hypothetical protein
MRFLYLAGMYLFYVTNSKSNNLKTNDNLSTDSVTNGYDLIKNGLNLKFNFKKQDSSISNDIFAKFKNSDKHNISN